MAGVVFIEGKATLAFYIWLLLKCEYDGVLVILVILVLLVLLVMLVLCAVWLVKIIKEGTFFVRKEDSVS